MSDDERAGLDGVRAAMQDAEDIAPDDRVQAPSEPRAVDTESDINPPPRSDNDGRGYDTPPPRTPDDLGPAVQGASYPLNDTGNGLRFALYCGERCLFVPRVGWHIWDGMRWRLDPDGIVVRRQAQTIQERIIQEIPHVVLEDWQLETIETEVSTRRRHEELMALDAEARSTEQKIELEELTQTLGWIKKLKDRRSGMKSDHRSFAKTSGNKGRIDAMLTEATTSLSREIDELDADPLTINTQSGVLRVTVDGGPGEEFSKTASFKLIPHARELPIADEQSTQVITKLMPVDHDPEADCPLFKAFLERVQPNQDMRRFLQRWWGLSMTGLPIQKFVFQYGKGANGKSVLSDLMRRIMGDYAAIAKIESITGRNQRGASDAAPDLMLLRGARVAVINEAEEGQKLQEKTIKDMTSFEPMLARNLFGDFISFVMLAKLTISGNHKPDIRGTDDGIWRRVLLVPFDVQIPEEERDEKLIDKLWEERSGILNWLLEGLLDYLEGGLQEPKEVLEATQEYRADSDPIGSFLAECCIVSGGPDDFVTSRELIDGFNLWMDQRGEGMWGQRTVSLKLKAEAGRYRDPTTNRPFTVGKRDVTGYRGVRFTTSFRASFDQAPRDSKGRPVAYAAARGGTFGDDTGGSA
ncbi:MAG: phage/plasmid primase, P4 family [Pseudomonadota bacterium]